MKYVTRAVRMKIWLEDHFYVLMIISTALELLMLAWIAYKA